MAQIVQGGCAISMPVYKTKDFSASSWVKTWGTWSDPSWTCCEQEVGLEVLWTPFQPELFSFSVVLHGSQVAIAPLGMVVEQDVHLCPRKCLLEKLATIPCSLFAKKKRMWNIQNPHSTIYHVRYIWCERYQWINSHSLVMLGLCLVTQNEWKL